MSLGEDLRTFLLADASIAALATVHQNQVPQHVTDNYIWFQRRGTEPHNLVNPPVGQKPLVEYFDIEIYCTNADTALDHTTGLLDLVRTRLNYFSGSFGTSTVLGVFVEDHDDSYIPKSVMGQEGYHVPSLDVKIIGA